MTYNHIVKQTTALDIMTNSSAFQTELINCRLPISEASSLPTTCYHSAEVLDTEIKTIFHRNWLGMGRADRFNEPGKYETMEIGGVPLLLINDREGKLHAFNNACRHRGARLLEGIGKCRTIRCPFHGWTYNTNGECAAASHMEDSKSFDITQLGLIEFPLKIHAGFVFVCFDAEPPSFQKHIGDFDKMLAPWPLETLVSTRRQSFEVKCNWKLFLDVFNEYYHLPYVHPDSINGLYNKPDPADTTTGSYASQFGKTEGTGALLENQQQYALPEILGLTGEAKIGTRYTWIFPNMTFAASTDSIWIYEAYPIGANRCMAYQTICFPSQTVDLDDFEEKAKYYYDRFDAAVEEDRIALENQQLGLASPFTKPGPYSPSMEPSVAAFARWYANQLQEQTKE